MLWTILAEASTRLLFTHRNYLFSRFPSQGSGGGSQGGQGGSGADNSNLYDDGDDDLYS